MNISAFSSGGYGTILQANYINKIYTNLKNSIFLHDDYKSKTQYIHHYKDFNKSSFIKDSIIIPSYEYISYMEFINQYFMPPVNWNDKHSQYLLFDNKYNANLYNGPSLIRKPLSGSGSKDISIFHKNEKEYIIQEYIQGEEFVIDCVLGKDHIYYSCRKSVSRCKGRDVEVSFEIPILLPSVVKEIIKSFKYYKRWIGTFNLQIIFDGDNFKLIEVDFRLSGSSIVNDAYNKLIKYYINNIRTPRIINYQDLDPIFIYIKGNFNNECISVYKDHLISEPCIF